MSGRDLSHRRAWVENRLLQLADIFTVHVYAYAIMSNHYHITVAYRPQERTELTDEEVARRWLRLFPPRHTELDQHIAKLVGDAERLMTLRDHLGDLSWYMRCLNEQVARRANREDDCTGRFWQGRCYTRALPDERSMWACMAYDDLNPLRAGIATGVDAEYTALSRRLAEAIETPSRFDDPVGPLVRRGGQVVNGGSSAWALDMSLRQYRDHVEWVAGGLYGLSTGQNGAPYPQLGEPESWLTLVASFRYRRGSATPPRWERTAE